jgi:UDP-N-acetylmuramoylalanine--D-glutamate ligase
MGTIYEALYTGIPELRGRRITVMGLGYFGGGVGTARFLARQGARVVVTDVKTEAELADSIEQLQGLDVTFKLGGHDPSDFTDADLVVFSPAIDPASPFLKLAIDRGVPLETELNLFFKLCRAKTTIGVTGSNGKTTTTVLTHEILKRLLGERAWLGGNVGISLLESVDRIQPDDVVVLEISSFQLEALRALRRSPNVSIVTNVTPNHLDRHGSMEAYALAKQAILDYQRPTDTCVLNLDDPIVRSMPRRSRRLGFSLERPSLEGAWASRGLDEIFLSDGTVTFELDIAGRRLPGRFNVQNMLAAACASYAACCCRPTEWARACEDVFRNFPGVEHRLEFVAQVGGVSFYNDSIATNPDSTIAALDALPGPFVMILGGYDKQLPFEALAQKIQERNVRCVVLMGQAAGKIRSVLESSGRPPRMEVVSSLSDAVHVCFEKARPSDQVLLSPACASFDQFRNYVERGRLFKKLVGELKRAG